MVKAVNLVTDLHHQQREQLRHSRAGGRGEWGFACYTITEAGTMGFCVDGLHAKTTQPLAFCAEVWYYAIADV